MTPPPEFTDSTTLRILDANFNRAREALRVIEDYTRFCLDDTGLSRSIKKVRHRLSKCISEKFGWHEPDQLTGQARPTSLLKSSGTRRVGFEGPRGLKPAAQGDIGTDAEELVRQRDIVHDVGAAIEVDDEYHRADSWSVAIAAAKRLSEALRVIEEFGKTISPEFAKVVERLRYEGYELERRLVITRQAIDRLANVKLYVIFTESLCRNDWFETARVALEGGANCLQLREKDLPDRELLDRAKRLARLCKKHEALFIVNDRPDIAALSGADGVHVGQNDLPISAIRRVLPPGKIVGISTHNIAQFKSAARETPDYIAVGPMFSTSTKPDVHPAGLSLLALARSQTALPLVSIGGITADNIVEVLNTAPCIPCICSSVISQQDPGAAAEHLISVIDNFRNKWTKVSSVQ